MKSNKNYYIYLRSIKERIPCTKEEFEAYYYEIDRYRIKQQYHGKCQCPKRQHLACDMDCVTCPYYTPQDLSLNNRFKDDTDIEHEYIEFIEDTSPLIDEIVADAERLQQLFHELSILMPEAIEIGKMRTFGVSDTEISRQLNIHRNTFASRIKKLKPYFEKNYKEFF